MNWLQKMKDAHAANQKFVALMKAENRALTEDEQKTFDANVSEISNCEQQLKNEKSVANVETALTTVVNTDGKPLVNGEKKPIYNNLTSQLIDVRNAATGGGVSAKLAELQNTMGMNEGVGSDGGYAVQTDFAGMIFESAIKDDGILALVDEYVVGGASNSVSWVDIAESDVSETVFGGIVAYWAAEAQAVAKSQPVIKEEKIELEKLMGLGYATMELDQDSTFIDELYTKGFTLAIRRMMVKGVIRGTGVGQMTGILGGDGLQTVAKAGGQAKETVVWDNIVDMYHTAIEPRSGGYAWLVHPDVHPQLDKMSVVVGTGGVPVYQPASMTGSVDTLRGLPVISSDQCSALGTPGDIILADLSDYFMPVKNEVQKDVSMHVKFLTAENAFRFIFRVNGRPKTNHLLKIANSTKKRARYVTLAARA